MQELIPDELQHSLAMIPAGAWGVGVSGGADSVALLRALCACRAELSLHVVHLDHQARGEQSAADARFVAGFADSLKLPSTIARLDELPANGRSPANQSARFRQARLALFSDVQRQQNLQGVILAHHARDQAETILQRLLRGAGPTGIAGMRVRTTLGSLTLLRPLLGTSFDTLRVYLRSIDQPWREDPSNGSVAYQRNRLRPMLQNDPRLIDHLLALGRAGEALIDWSRTAAEPLQPIFARGALAHLPATLGREAARTWLIAAGSPPAALTRPVLDQLRYLSSDSTTPHAQVFPGNIRVRRRAGLVFVDA